MPETKESTQTVPSSNERKTICGVIGVKCVVSRHTRIVPSSPELVTMEPSHCPSLLSLGSPSLPTTDPAVSCEGVLQF